MIWLMKQVVLMDTIMDKEANSFDIASISLQAIDGSPNPRTMQVINFINRK